MRRLAREEIKDLTKRLGQWQPPQIMLHLVEATMDELGSKNLFNQAGLAFLRDAWTGSRLGLTRGAEKVRLVQDTWPDFELRIGGHVEAFEAVEADDPNRRRGLEYQKDDGEVEYDPVENWIARADQAPGRLIAASLKKARKRYGGHASLVIYLNLNEFGIRQAEIQACFSSATESAKDDFNAVWILWKDRAYRVWEGAAADSTVLIATPGNSGQSITHRHRI